MAHGMKNHGKVTFIEQENFVTFTLEHFGTLSFGCLSKVNGVLQVVVILVNPLSRCGGRK
jgi:hypothetical protein